MTKHFTTRQIVFLGILMSITVTSFHAPAQAAEAEQHMFLTPLPAALVLAFSVWVLRRVQRRFSDQDLFAALISRFPAFGRLLVLLYFVFNLVVMARDLRMLTDHVTITLLPLTPIIATAFFLLITIIFMVRGGIGTLVGMAEMFIPFLIATALVLPIALGKAMDLSLLRPMFDFNPEGFVRGSWHMLAYMADLAVLPYVLSGKNYRLRSGLGGVLGGTLLLMILLILQQTVLGPLITARLTFPSYEIARQLQVTDFLDRFDLLIAAATLPTVIIKVGFDLYVLCSASRRLLPAVKGELTVLPIGILGFVCTFWFFENLPQVFAFSREWTVYVLIFYVVLPVVFLVILHPKKV
ncbi:endospore germination permease [Paenibacillus sp. P96]|uniref:Endospore germination permease n=1 Tax=Paenibacillus zeirhizosphaerae TaxID=2987519 RepID=A0ABT9FN52_9BACL|nr:endospore germination permease [Paenibacillus sp. P96]MDP4096166.1 endospore germination permease [Paenibacillus sp. P96]